MHRVNAYLTTHEIEPGWACIDESVPLGKRYELDLDDVHPATLGDLETGRLMTVEAVRVLTPGAPGYLPLAVFDFGRYAS